MFYDKDYEVNFAEIDNREVARPSMLFHIIQDAAVEHAAELHISRENLGVVWVLSKLRIQVNHPLRVHDIVHLRTWCAGIKGPNWLRQYELSTGGSLLGSVMSTWVTLDPEQHRIIRPNHLPLDDDLDAKIYHSDFVVPGKLKFSGFAPHHVHTVRYSDLDINGHMNNVKIVDIICDGLDLDRREGLFVDDLQVNYVSECMPGEEIEISTGEDEKGYIGVCGMVDGKMKFEAAAHFAPYTA